MGLMSLFTNSSPEQVCQKIASEIVVSALDYRLELDETNPRIAGHAAVEIAYLLLHLVDREAFKVLGPAGRNDIFDKISKIVISDYARALFKPTTSSNSVTSVSRKMFDDMNDRQSIYGACQALTGDPWPSRGTMIFACDYFIYRALEQTDRTDVDGVLRGEQDVTEANHDAFPDMDHTMTLAVYILNCMSKLRIPEKLRKLV